MKRLIFVDADPIIKEGDLCFVRMFLENCGVKDPDIEKINEFASLCRDKAYDILFDDNSAILTWSMYTSVHYDSLGMLKSYLKAAGMNNIRDRIYFDCSGGVKEAVERIIREGGGNIILLLKAIETNFIITHNQWDGVCRLRVDLTNLDGYTRLEEISPKRIQNLISK